MGLPTVRRTASSGRRDDGHRSESAPGGGERVLPPSAAGERGEPVADLLGAHLDLRLAGGEVEGDRGVDLAGLIGVAEVLE